MSEQVAVDQYVLATLYRYYHDNPHEHVTEGTLYFDVFYWIEESNPGYNLTETELFRALEYLVAIGFVNSHLSSYRLTGQGAAYVDNPYGSSMALEQKNTDIAQKSLEINQAMLYITIVSLLVAVISLFLAWLAISPR